MRKKIKGFIDQFFLINDTPHKIAAGAAIGVLFGIAPGEGLATTLVMVSLLKFNRLSATLGVMATNMWSTLVVLPFAAAIGSYFFEIEEAYLVNQFYEAYQLGYMHLLNVLVDIALPLLVGYLIIAGLSAFLVYLLLYFAILLLNDKK